MPVYSCPCLNVKIHVESTEAERAALEDIKDVLECTLDSKAVQMVSIL